MPDLSQKMREALERMRQRAEDPSFQARVAELEAGEPSAEEMRRRQWKRQDIPEEHWRFLDSPAETEAIGLVRTFLGNDDRFLLLAGTAGRGKTLAACWALTQKGGRYVRTRAVATAGFDDEGWLYDLAHAPLLVLDEMVREAQDEKGWAYSKVYDLLDRRQSNLRKTILITNAGLDEWKARYCPDGKADPLYDRIASRGTVPTPLTGPSMRRGSL
jgi:DNA replication protein DnaC